MSEIVRAERKSQGTETPWHDLGCVAVQERVGELERENVRLQRLVGELLVKNQQLRAAVAG